MATKMGSRRSSAATTCSFTRSTALGTQQEGDEKERGEAGGENVHHASSRTSPPPSTTELRRLGATTVRRRRGPGRYSSITAAAGENMIDSRVEARLTGMGAARGGVQK